MTQVPSPTLSDAGLSIPTDALVKAGVLADMDAAMGGGMNLDQDENPLGQLAVSEAAIIGDKNSQFLSLVNNIDPKFASGRMQDAIARIYFITRFPATSTSVPIECFGADGTVIPTGVRIRGIDNNTYASASAGTIQNGTCMINFACETTGPIPCGIGNLTTSNGAKIITSVSGWESIANSAEGALGSNVEGRAAFEERRAATVAKNGIHTLDSIQAAVIDVPGVLDVYAVQNVKDEPKLIGGVLLPGHCIYVAVVGGDDAAVANAIRTKISMGCDMLGNTTILVPDDRYEDPKPTFPATFNRPDDVPIKFAIAMASGTTAPNDAANQIQNAVIGAFAGTDGGTRAGIGRRLFASRFYDPIKSIGSWATNIVSIEIGTDVPNLFSLLLDISKKPTVAQNDIQVTFV